MTMQSLRELYRIGFGPSSSHTMGPASAAISFRQKHPQAQGFSVLLYGSLAATGRGHGTDAVLLRMFAPHPTTIIWQPDQELPGHPNGMDLIAHDGGGCELGRWRGYSVGGGAVRAEGDGPAPGVYDLTSMVDILAWSAREAQPLWAYVIASEGTPILGYLAGCWQAMRRCLVRGLEAEGELPGGLRLQRRARRLVKRSGATRSSAVSAFALAIMEENAAGGEVVTAPTCGSCGIVPAVVARLQGELLIPDETVYQALATAGLVGNLVKTNASISGSEVGCQGEVGTACAMAAAAAAQLMGGNPWQIECAAEMGLEHHLGLTCDPVLGLVQMPCIERNALAATRALDCAELALCSDGKHRISFDEAVCAMAATGRDMHRKYRETAEGGLAALRPPPGWLMGS